MTVPYKKNKCDVLHTGTESLKKLVQSEKTEQTKKTDCARIIDVCAVPEQYETVSHIEGDRGGWGREWDRGRKRGLLFSSPLFSSLLCSSLLFSYLFFCLVS